MDIDRSYCNSYCKGWRETGQCFSDGTCAGYVSLKANQHPEKSEKPMNQEELEKAVVDYFEGYWPGMETAEQCNTDLRFTPPAIMRLARHFAKWGAEHLKKED